LDKGWRAKAEIFVNKITLFGGSRASNDELQSSSVDDEIPF